MKKRGMTEMFRLFRMFVVSLGLVLLLGGCTGKFSDEQVWLYRYDKVTAEVTGQAPDENIPAYDLFYVYPTLVSNRELALMDFSDAKVMRKAYDFSEAQSGIFASAQRIFVPKIRQLEFGRCMKYLANQTADFSSGEMRPGIDDTKAALRIYLEKYNDKPYILFGHSQGAMDLYYAMKELPSIAADKNFVAAYLIGLPRMSVEQIAADFAGRNIKMAQQADDAGVIIVWNSQAPGAENPIFTTKNGYVINPVNWRVDSTPGSAAENSYSKFYDYRMKNSAERITVYQNLCGAVADPQKGALLLEVPIDKKFGTADDFMGKGVFHVSDVWFFAGNMDANAQERVKAWQKIYKK
ncbi:MAG: DUF3089 domain-containing protein [Victivallaceae bacterium]